MEAPGRIARRHRFVSVTGVSRGLQAVLCAVALLLAVAPAASASQSRSFLSSFGTLSGPSFVAVDNSGGASDGDVYVAESSSVWKFDSSGSVIAGWGSSGQLDGSTATDGPFGSIAGIAVGSSGTLHVLNTSSRMFKFAQDGSFLTDFEVARGTEVTGIAVDATGDFYKANGDSSVEKFDSSGADLGLVTANASATGLAVDTATDDLYVASGDVIQRYSFPGPTEVAQPSSGPCTFEPFLGCGPTATLGSGLSGVTGLAVDPSSHHIYVDEGSQVVELDSSGNPFATFGSGKLGNSHGVAARTAGNVFATDAGAGDVSVFGGVVTVPTVTPSAASAISLTAATLNGVVNPDSTSPGDALTACHFEYGLSSSYGETAPCVPGFASIPTDESDHAVSAAFSGLTAGTVYHFQLVAGNANGTNASVDQTFSTTPEPPVVTTTAGGTGITQTAANVAGTVNPNGGPVSDCHVEYGLSAPAYGSSTPCNESPASLGSGKSAEPVTASLTGLLGNKTYHFRVVAINGGGTGEGTDQTFTTPVDPPTVTTTKDATAVTLTSATVAGTVNPNEGNVSDCYIEYGPSTVYGSQEPCAVFPGSGPSPVAVSAGLTGLTEHTIYHFRVVATNSGGTAKGPDQTFIADPSFPTSNLDVHPSPTEIIGADGQPLSAGNHFHEAENLAIDQATHRLYVLNREPGGGESVISAYDISVPGTYTPVGGEFPISGPGINAGNSFHDIAVDQTASPSPTAGNLYATESSAFEFTTELHGWSSTGAPLNAAHGSPSFPITLYVPDPNLPREQLGNRESTIAGVGVDPDGGIWLTNYSSCGTPFGNTRGEIDKYSPLTGARTFFVDTHEQGDIPEDQLGCANYADFDSNGDMYVAFGNGAFGPGETAGVWKYPAADSYTTASRIDPQSAQDVAVDRSTHLVYAVHGNSGFSSSPAVPGIDVYDSAGALFERFGTTFPEMRGVAIDESTGIVYASDGSSIIAFRGAPVPAVGAVTNLTRSTATLNGHLDPAGGPDFTSCHVEYAADSVFKATGYTDLVSPGKALAGSRPCNATPPYDAQYVNDDLSGLNYGTVYHYRLVASNASGDIRSTDHTFQTAPAVPGVSTEAATDLTQTSATLNGSFVGSGHDTYYFQWGQTAAYGHTIGSPLIEDTGVVSVSEGLSGLATFQSSSEPIHYRLVVTSDTGTTYGADRTFFTLPPTPPTVSGSAVSGVSSTGATVSAMVNPHLGDTLFAVQYGTSTSYGSSTPTSASIGGDQTDHPVSAVLSGLLPGTKYHYRVVAINFGGTSYGPDGTFTTPGPPRIDSTDLSAVRARTAHLSVQVSAGGNPTDVHLEYGTSGGYGQSTAGVPVGSEFTDRAAETDLSGLAPNTTYHVRAVAINSAGSVVGPDQTFTTLPEAPPPPEEKPCKKGFVRRSGKCVKHRRRHVHRKHHQGKRRDG